LSKENMVSMQITEEIYLVDLEECKNYLHGNILLIKGINQLHIWIFV